MHDMFTANLLLSEATNGVTSLTRASFWYTYIHCHCDVQAKLADNEAKHTKITALDTAIPSIHKRRCPAVCLVSPAG
jgi:hypothetical protein